MNLKAKIYEQDRKRVNEQKLAARLAILKEKGLNEAAMEKDALVKKINADIRKTVHRLRAIAAHEKLLAGKKKAKADKLAAEKASVKADTAKKPGPKAPMKDKKTKAKKPAAAK